MELPCSFEFGTSGLVIEHVNHENIAPEEFKHCSLYFTSHHVLCFHDIKFLTKFNCTLKVSVGKNLRMYYGDVREDIVEEVIMEVETHGEWQGFHVTWRKGRKKSFIKKNYNDKITMNFTGCVKKLLKCTCCVEFQLHLSLTFLSLAE